MRHERDCQIFLSLPSPAFLKFTQEFRTHPENYIGKMLQFFVFLGLLSYAGGQFVNATHGGLTQQARLQCFPRNGTYVMKFTLLAKDDQISIVYLTDPTNSRQNTVGTLDSQQGAITGNGSDADPYMLEIAFNGPEDSLSAVNPNVLFRTISAGVVQIHIISKEISDSSLFYSLIFANDVIWIGSCNFTQVIAVNGELQATGSVLEDSSGSNDFATMEIVTPTGPTPVAGIGSDIYLRLIMLNDSATGVYGYNCFVCDQIDCTGAIKVPFLDEIGCPTSSNFISSFRFLDGQFQTPVFQAFALSTQPILFFRCSVGFCFEPNQPECINFCDANSKKRRKRVAFRDDPVLNVTVSLRIVKSLTGNPTLDNPQSHIDNTSPGESNESMLIIAVITLACLLTIVLLIAVALFIHIRLDRKSDRS